MSVFTTISSDDLKFWLKNYSLGELRSLKGIESGIENTNYFVKTTTGQYVLTIFEKLRFQELNYYLNLMSYLFENGLPVPNPIENLAGDFVNNIKNKPAAIVTRLEGKPVEFPNARHCDSVGKVLARIHQAGLSYKRYMVNQMGFSWGQKIVPAICPFLDSSTEKLLTSEISFQAKLDRTLFPSGVIHADLFRDNVLFKGNKLLGVIDFYFACNDALVYDLAIAVNDWCRNDVDELDLDKTRSLVNGYQQIRPLEKVETNYWCMMLRAAALRFWLSRLYDFHLPRQGELTHAHSPDTFQKLLQNLRNLPKKYEELIF